MSCDNLSGDLLPCGMERENPQIEDAGRMVGLDLTTPIDCSQMSVHNVSSTVLMEDNYYGKMYVQRESVLHAYVYNEQGEREELTITFQLKSRRQPKPK